MKVYQKSSFWHFVRQMPVPLWLLSASLVGGQLTAFRFGWGVVYLHDIAILGLIALVLWRPKRSGVQSLRLAKPFMLLAGVFALSLVVGMSSLPNGAAVPSGAYLLRFIWYLTVYAAAVVLFRADDWVRCAAVTSVGILIIGFLQLLLYPDLRNLWYLGWDPHYYRLFSTLLDPNFAGLVLVIGVFAGLAAFRSHTGRFLPLAYFLAHGIGILLTYSRSTYLALGAGMFWLAVMKRKPALILLPGLFLVLFLAVPKPDIIGFDVFRTQTVVSRMENWTAAWEEIRRAPVLGYGFNTLRFRGNQQLDGIPDHAAGGVDNSYLFIILTSGFVGVMAFSAVVYAVIRLITQGPERRPGQSLPVLTAALVAILVHALFINSLFYPWILIMTMMLLGVIERVRNEKASVQGE